MPVFDHPFLAGLLGDDAVSALLSAPADIKAMLHFEVALAGAEEAEGLIPAGSAARIGAAADAFSADLVALNEATARDGVVVPGLLAQLRKGLDAEAAKALHFGATSQDVIDTSFAMRAVAVLDLIGERLASVIAHLDRLEARDGSKTVMAHTRMQAAMPVTASRKIASWRGPLLRQAERLGDMRAAIGILHFGGPVGTLGDLGDKGPAVAKRLAEALGLQLPQGVRHTERDAQAALAGWLASVTGSLGKAGADITLFSQQEMDEIELSRGGGSSAMPHKVNPVGAEMLVTLARFNATLVSGMHQAMVHENERSGAAWTLEWMILPQMLLATAAAIRTADGLFQSISFVAID